MYRTLLVVTASIARGADPQRAVLLALSTWFAVQGIVAIVGIATGTVGGLAWLAIVVDPLVAAWFFDLSRNVQRNSPVPL
jgi:hypothetical protein